MEFLSQQVSILEKKIASLSTNSTNSSKPPSSDGPGVAKSKKKKSSRSRGGQKGHQGQNRELRSVEEMNHVHDHHPLDPESCEEISSPLRNQRFELPEIKPIMTEHHCHQLRCPCGHKTRAEFPSNVAQSQFGPRVHGATGYLSSVHKIGHRGIVEIMTAAFNGTPRPSMIN